MGNYAIVTDWELWWIVGDEGPYDDEPYANDYVAHRAARNLLKDGYEIDPNVYYVQTDDDRGPDWDHPRRFSEGSEPYKDYEDLIGH